MKAPSFRATGRDSCGASTLAGGYVRSCARFAVVLAAACAAALAVAPLAAARRQTVELAMPGVAERLQLVPRLPRG
jgi:hypothetical protein